MTQTVSHSMSHNIFRRSSRSMSHNIFRRSSQTISQGVSHNVDRCANNFVLRRHLNTSILMRKKNPVSNKFCESWKHGSQTRSFTDDSTFYFDKFDPKSTTSNEEFESMDSLIRSADFVAYDFEMTGQQLRLLVCIDHKK